MDKQPRRGVRGRGGFAGGRGRFGRGGPRRAVGTCHRRAGKNGFHLTVTDAAGKTVAQRTGGRAGFSGARRKTPFAARSAGRQVATLARAKGVQRLRFRLKGRAYRGLAAARGLQAGGRILQSLEDVTPVPHGGCRPKGLRRV